MTKKEKMIFERIVKETMGIETLEQQYSDSLDFHDVSVWSLQAALERAYHEGQKSVKQ